jgi:hypothetical protein
MHLLHAQTSRESTRIIHTPDEMRFVPKTRLAVTDDARLPFHRANLHEIMTDTLREQDKA